MIVVGQPELKQKLQRKKLAQLAQRVTSHCHLAGLKKDEIAEYIRYRLNVGGAENLDIFDKEATEIIGQYSRGIPRLINILCDTALVFGFADRLEIIDKTIVKRVIQEREAGGLFCEFPDSLPSAPHTDSEVFEISRSKILSIEKRVRLLEHVICNMDRKLNRLSKKREERDKIVIELFKMLKMSMESRWNLLKKFDYGRNHVPIAPGSRDDSDPGPGSFFSSLWSTRILWILIAVSFTAAAMGFVDRCDGGGNFLQRFLNTQRTFIENSFNPSPVSAVSSETEFKATSPELRKTTAKSSNACAKSPHLLIEPINQ